MFFKSQNSSNWIKCEKCKSIIFKQDLEENLYVCNKCNYHFVINAHYRIKITFDNFVELYKEIYPKDFLNFDDYSKKLKEDQEKTNLSDAIIVGVGNIKNDQNKHKVSIGIMDFNFRGGSMGSVVGEKIALISEYALKNDTPLIIFSSSGGARMQEGIISLMQMAKTVSVIKLLNKNRIPFINVITHPTTGGVAASFVGIADIILSEPGALIGFAGQRVIEQTIKQKLPQDFQTAEFSLKYGLIDNIVHRHNIPSTLIKFINSFYFYKIK
ncbi:MAG: acetyl-CoA carboxylase, carboxyltransferase subunit beta [bacterium]|jgi:acetyl-CoA carboxylase carboxyl transferase subunit beta